MLRAYLGRKSVVIININIIIILGTCLVRSLALLYATPSCIICYFYPISFTVRDESVINK